MTETRNASSIDRHLKHYVACFDPSTGRLDVTEAKHMIVRSVVRQFKPESEQPDPSQNLGYASRGALTEAFGTKKSKRAFQSMAENRLLAAGDQDEDNPLSQAITSAVEDEAEELPESAQKTKPLPQANTETSDIAQVYSLNTLVKPHLGVLKSMPLNDWRSSYEKTKQIRTSSRFVSNRFGWLMPAHVASPEDEIHLTRLQLLRYIYLLLELHRYVMKSNQRAAIQDPSKWPEGTISGNFSEAALREILKHFFPDRRTNKSHLTLLRSTILALTLHIPPPSLNPGKDMLITEPTDIALDLAIEKEESVKLWRELGCKIDAPRDAELERWGLSKLYKQKKTNDDGKQVKAAAPKFVKLAFPLQFVKASRGKPPATSSRRY